MKIILSLITIVAISLGTIPALAESSSIIVNSDKSVYQTGDTMSVSGTIEELKMPVIAMRIFDPNGLILSANNVEIEDDNTFSKVIFLDSPFFEESGKYLITLDYGKESVKLNFEIDNGLIIQESESVSEEIIPEIIFLNTSQSIYYDDDFIEIIGEVSLIDESSVLIGIFDTFGMPAGFYFGEINSDNKFSVSFLAKSGVNFKTEGTYLIKAFYGDSESEKSFDFLNEKPLLSKENDEEKIVEETVEEQIIDEVDDDNPSKEKEEDVIIKEPADDDNLINEEPITSVQENNEDSQPKNDPLQENVETKNNKEIIAITQDTQSPPKLNESKQPKQKTLEKPLTKLQPNNLSVEDVALGIMLNQMILNCNTSEYNDFISYYDGMGPALMRLCKYNQALSFFDQELADDPYNLKILTNKGAALSKLGLNKESILYYDAALELESNYLPALNNKANALAQMGAWDDAISTYEYALELYPTNNLLTENLNHAQEEIPNFTKSTSKQQSSIQQITTNVAEKTTSNVKDVKERPSNVLEEIEIVLNTFSTMIFGFLN